MGPAAQFWEVPVATSPEDRAAAIAEQERRAEHAQQLLQRYVLAEFKDDHPTHHMTACPSTRITDFDARDGSYGCETGCSYYTLAATVTCDHEFMEYTYGDFGDVSDMIAWLVKNDPGEAADSAC